MVVVNAVKLTGSKVTKKNAVFFGFAPHAEISLWSLNLLKISWTVYGKMSCNCIMRNVLKTVKLFTQTLFHNMQNNFSFEQLTLSEVSLSYLTIILSPTAG